MALRLNYRLFSSLNGLVISNFSTERMTTVTTADKFFNHLEKDSGNIENSLSRVSAKLDSKCVSEVLSRCYPKRSHMGLRFFIWAGLQSSYRHSAYMYGRACKLLDIRKNPQMVFNVIEAYRVEGSFVTVNTFKVVLKLCKEAQLADVALWALRKIPEFSLQADTTVYNLVIRLFSEKGDTEMAENLMKEMGLSDLYPDIITYITMIEGFCNVGRLEDAYMLIGVMRGNGCFPNTVVYSALLGGFCRSGNMEKAFELLGEMEKAGGSCSPNVVTYTSMIQSFCEKGRWMEALETLDRMEAFGCSPNRVTVSTLISGLCEEGLIQEAYKLIDKVVGGKYVSYGDCYSSLVISLVRMKKVDEAEKLFREMLAGGLKPDSLACSILIKELCMESRVLDGYYLLHEIENTGCLSSIDSDIYHILLGRLCRQSHMVEATKHARVMLNKGIALKHSYDKSIVENLKKSGEEELIKHLTGI